MVRGIQRVSINKWIKASHLYWIGKKSLQDRSDVLEKMDSVIK